MKIIRWIIYLPVAAVLIAVAQIATGLMAENLAWWVAAPLIFFFGALIMLAPVVPCTMAPNPRKAAIILLVLFVLLEGISLISALPQATIFEGIVRIYTDALITFGAIAACLDSQKSTANLSR